MINRLNYLQFAANAVTAEDRKDYFAYNKNLVRYETANRLKLQGYADSAIKRIVEDCPEYAPTYSGREPGHVPVQFQTDMNALGYTDPEIQEAINKADQNIFGNPVSNNLISDDWTQEQRRQALDELVQEYLINHVQEESY